MFLDLTLVFLTAFLLPAAFGLPTYDLTVNNTIALQRRGNVAPLSPEKIEHVWRYIEFARTCYCTFEQISEWDCGEACQKTAPVIPIKWGGDGHSKPDWHIVYSIPLDALVIVHEGTDTRYLKSVALDLKVAQKPLKKRLFPEVNDDRIQIHRGFRRAHGLSAETILIEVQKALFEGVLTDFDGERRFPKKVVVTGHSLGGATATLDGLYLRLRLPLDVEVSVLTVGAPMVGNPAFAEWADSVLPGELNIRVVNGKDFIPRVPTHTGPHWLQAGIEYHVWNTPEGPMWFDCGPRTNYEEDPRCSRGFSPYKMHLHDHLWVEDRTMINACGLTVVKNYWSSENFDPKPDVFPPDYEPPPFEEYTFVDGQWDVAPVH